LARSRFLRGGFEVAGGEGHVEGEADDDGDLWRQDLFRAVAVGPFDGVNFVRLEDDAGDVLGGDAGADERQRQSGSAARRGGVGPFRGEEVARGDVEAELLAYLAAGGGAGGLVEVDDSSGQAPAGRLPVVWTRRTRWRSSVRTARARRGCPGAAGGVVMSPLRA
jgi:hypothetical protein